MHWRFLAHVERVRTGENAKSGVLYGARISRRSLVYGSGGVHLCCDLCGEMAAITINRHRCQVSALDTTDERRQTQETLEARPNTRPGRRLPPAALSE